MLTSIMNFQRQTRGGIVENRVKVEIVAAYTMACEVTMMRFDVYFREPQLRYTFLLPPCCRGLQQGSVSYLRD